MQLKYKDCETSAVAVFVVFVVVVVVFVVVSPH